MGLTVIIQGILSTIIVGVLVRSDIRARRIEAFKYHWPETSRLHDGTVFQRKLASGMVFTIHVSFHSKAAFSAGLFFPTRNYYFAQWLERFDGTISYDYFTRSFTAQSYF